MPFLTFSKKISFTTKAANPIYTYFLFTYISHLFYSNYHSNYRQSSSITNTAMTYKALFMFLHQRKKENPWWAVYMAYKQTE